MGLQSRDNCIIKKLVKNIAPNTWPPLSRLIGPNQYYCCSFVWMRIRDKTSASIGQDFKIGGERKRNITQHVAANMIEDLIRILVCCLF